MGAPLRRAVKIVHGMISLDQIQSCRNIQASCNGKRKPVHVGFDANDVCLAGGQDGMKIMTEQKKE